MTRSGSLIETADRPKPSVPTAKTPRPAPLRRRPRRRWVRWLKWGIALIVVAGAIVGWRLWSNHQAAIVAAAKGAARIVTVQRATVEKSVDSSGGVKSNSEVEIKCRASGEVVTLPFDVSDHVKKGDLVCQLDPTDEALEVRKAEVTVLESKVKLEQARDDLAESRLNLETTGRKAQSALEYAKVRAANLKIKAGRQQQLFDQKLGSQEELETAQTEAAAAAADESAAQIAVDELEQKAIEIKSKEQAVAMAEAELQSDQVTLDTQKQLLAYTTVTSPIDGVVTKLTVERGTIVASGTDAINGGTAILTVSDLSQLLVSAKVDESDIGGVKVGQEARISVSAFPSRTFSGKVTRVAPMGTVEANIVTFEVIISVDDKDQDLLRPEMTGNTTIVEDRRQNVLTLPPMAVRIEKDGAHVTMADGQQRSVKVGLRSADYVEILSGLKEGDRVTLGDAELPTRWRNDGGFGPE